MKKILFSIAMLVLTTTAFSQNCINILPPTSFSGPDANGKYTLTINYETDGNKTLETSIKCGSTEIFYDCFSVTGVGTKVYSNLSCSGGIPALKATFTPRTGSCNSAQCAPTTTTGPDGGVLPVQISSFTAARSKQVVTINWNTEFEIDTKEFIVERAEGTEFRSVGTTLSTGNSSTKKSYSFNDNNENAGITYYRLKNIDLNGKYIYTDIKTVKGYGAVDGVTVFPNPARSNSKISLIGVAANSSIQLLDFSGKILKNINSTTINSLDLSGVKNGTYLIRIVDKSTNEIVNRKLTVTN